MTMIHAHNLCFKAFSAKKKRYPSNPCSEDRLFKCDAFCKTFDEKNNKLR